jgi:putative nucleotidyltransferase with HDIG domain
MVAEAARVRQRARRSWDVGPTSPSQERFYRELMGWDRLPSAPEIARRMLVALNREDASVQPLANLILRDQSLAARLLRVANSAFFAVRTQITSIPQAITLLGFARVREVALSLSVWDALDAKSSAARRHRRQMWVHSAMVAAAARLVAERTGGDAATAFTAGLLHDVGKLVLGLRLGDSYWSLLEEAAAHGQDAATVEADALGCTHASVGGWFLQIWQLPPAIIDPVALHHEPLIPEFGFDVTAAVAVANRLVDATAASGRHAARDTMAEVEGFAPGLLRAAEWRDVYAALAREQHEVASLFAA